MLHYQRPVGGALSRDRPCSQSSVSLPALLLNNDHLRNHFHLSAGLA